MSSPVSLPRRLREMQAELDAAADACMAHCRDHGCRRGHHGLASTCSEAKGLADRVADARYQLSMTRFLNEDG
jgi:hypothetical protein